MAPDAAATGAREGGAVSAAMRWAAAGAAILVFAVATKTGADPDLWGHLRFGLDTVRTLTLTPDDPYSFTQDRPWVNHEWISEAQIGLAYLAGGVAGLALLKGALVFGALLLVWSALRGLDLAARMVTIGVVAVGTGPITSPLRPQLWTLLLLAILCRTLAGRQQKAARWLPLLFAAWANLHGGWIVGLGVLGVWAAADVCVNRRGAVEWTTVVLASMAATLATPYGFSLWLFVWDTVHLTRDIAEWQPLFALPIAHWIPWVAALVASILATWRPHPHRVHIAAVSAMLAYASLRVVRVGPLFVMCVATLFAPLISSRWPARPVTRPVSPVRYEGLVAAGLVVLAIAGAGWLTSTSLRCVEVSGTWVPPGNAVRLLAGAPAGRVVTSFDWGEYAIWHLGPRLRVSMDGRRETVYSDQRLAEHDAILAGEAAGFRALESWQADYVWLPARSTATKGWLAAHGYRIELDAPESFVAVRADLPTLKAPPQSALSRRCFPD